MGTYDDFWGKVSPAIPGMLELGLGAYTRNRANSEAAQRLATAQGPLYNESAGAATGMLSQLQQFNPQDFAQQRFQAHQALVAPVEQKQQEDLMRMLRAKGMLGISSYNPGVEGITPNGTPMNPQMAAFFAAQNAARAKAADASIGQGLDYRNQLVTNAGSLTSNAGRAQQTGLQAQMTQPSRAAGNGEFLKGALGVLKDSGALKSGIGMLGNGVSWLGKKVGDWFNPQASMMDSGDFDWA